MRIRKIRQQQACDSNLAVAMRIRAGSSRQACVEGRQCCQRVHTARYAARVKSFQCVHMRQNLCQVRSAPARAAFVVEGVRDADHGALGAQQFNRAQRLQPRRNFGRHKVRQQFAPGCEEFNAGHHQLGRARRKLQARAHTIVVSDAQALQAAFAGHRQQPRRLHAAIAGRICVAMHVNALQGHARQYTCGAGLIDDRLLPETVRMPERHSAMKDDLIWSVRGPVVAAAACGLAAGIAITGLAVAGAISRTALGTLANAALLVFVLLPILLTLILLCTVLWVLVGMVAELQRTVPAWSVRAAAGTENIRREVVAWCRRVQEVVHAVQHPLDGARRAWQRYWGGRDLGFPARD